MKQIKHTKLPWRIERAELEYGNDQPPDWGLSICHNGETICDLYEHQGTNFFRFDRHEANARLIAACPVMYDYIAQKAKDGDAEAVRLMAVI